MASSKAAFHWDDPLLLSAQLSDDERMVRDAAHALILGRAQTGIAAFGD